MLEYIYIYTYIDQSAGSMTFILFAVTVTINV